MKTEIDRYTGYERIRLMVGSIHKKATVHRLVLEAFVGPCPPKHLACHFDGNKLNNRLDNLRWDTQKANASDRVHHKRAGKKLQVEDVREIRRLHGLGKKYAEIAALFDIDSSMVGKIIIGDCWRLAT